MRLKVHLLEANTTFHAGSKFPQSDKAAVIFLSRVAFGWDNLPFFFFLSQPSKPHFFFLGTKRAPNFIYSASFRCVLVLYFHDFFLFLFFVALLDLFPSVTNFRVFSHLEGPFIGFLCSGPKYSVSVWFGAVSVFIAIFARVPGGDTCVKIVR